MLETITARLGYPPPPLGFCLALPCAIHTFVFLALSIIALVIHLSGTQAEWMNALGDRDRWGYWNPLHVLFTIWYGWPIVVIVALIVAIPVGLVAGFNRAHTLRLLLQIDGVTTVLLAVLLFYNCFRDRAPRLRTHPSPAD